MKRSINILSAVLILSVTVSSCKKKFEDYSVNTNKPTSVPASLLFNGILNDMTDGHYSMNER